LADDCTVAADSEDDLQCLADCFSEISKGLMISTRKTEVLHQAPPGTNKHETNITIDHTQLKNAEHFTYLNNCHSFGSLEQQDAKLQARKDRSVLDCNCNLPDLWTDRSGSWSSGYVHIKCAIDIIFASSRTSMNLNLVYRQNFALVKVLIMI
jgi:hypothetical protein